MMIRGFVNEKDMKAIVRLKLYSAGQEVFMDFEIDTGAGLEFVLPSSNFAPLDARRHAGRAHGLLGRELLRTASLTINYPNRSVTIEPVTASN